MRIESNNPDVRRATWALWRGLRTGEPFGEERIGPFWFDKAESESFGRPPRLIAEAFDLTIHGGFHSFTQIQRRSTLISLGDVGLKYAFFGMPRAIAEVRTFFGE
jgi:hypothetical protein